MKKIFILILITFINIFVVLGEDVEMKYDDMKEISIYETKDTVINFKIYKPDNPKLKTYMALTLSYTDEDFIDYTNVIIKGDNNIRIEIDVNDVKHTLVEVDTDFGYICTEDVTIILDNSQIELFKKMIEDSNKIKIRYIGELEEDEVISKAKIKLIKKIFEKWDEIN